MYHSLMVVAAIAKESNELQHPVTETDPCRKPTAEQTERELLFSPRSQPQLHAQVPPDSVVAMASPRPPCTPRAASQSKTAA